jgi:hypothetical protein
MAFPAENPDKTKMAHGPIIVTFTSSTLGRVLDFKGNEEVGLIDIRGGNPDQLIDVIEDMAAPGDLEITVDVFPDIQASTVAGRQASFTLSQGYPHDATKKVLYSASNVYVNVLTPQGQRTGGVSTVTLRVRPYAAVGSDTHTWDNDASTA